MCHGINGELYGFVDHDEVDTFLFNVVKESAVERPLDMPKEGSELLFDCHDMILGELLKEICFFFFQENPTESILGRKINIRDFRMENMLHG